MGGEFSELALSGASHIGAGRVGVLFCKIIRIPVLGAFGCGVVWDTCNGVKYAGKARFTEARFGTVFKFPADLQSFWA